MKTRPGRYSCPSSCPAAAPTAALFKRLLPLLGLVAAVGCATATNAPVKPMTAPASAAGAVTATQDRARPQVIYVSDFYLDTNNLHAPAKLLKQDGPVRGRVGRVRASTEAVRGDDPVSRARKLIQVLSETIVTELSQAGQRAEYLPNRAGLRPEFHPADAVLPNAGWLVGGWFVNVQENRAAVEATAGFGQGAGEVELAVVVYDLGRDKQNPFLYLGTETAQRAKPGGLLTMNPYVMGAKFLLARGATEKDVKQQAKVIARKLMQCIPPAATERERAPSPAR